MIQEISGALTFWVPGLLSGPLRETKGTEQWSLAFWHHWLGSRITVQHQEVSGSREGEGIHFARQHFTNLEGRVDFRQTGGVGQGTHRGGRAFCGQTVVNWCARASARVPRGLELIVSPALDSLSLCLFFEMNGAFSSYPYFFSFLGYSSRLFYFPVINWPVWLVFQLSFMGQGQYISFQYMVLAKLSSPFLFPWQPSAYLKHRRNFLAGTFGSHLLYSLLPWAAVRAWKQSYVADFELVTMSRYVNQAPWCIIIWCLHHTNRQLIWEWVEFHLSVVPLGLA